MRITSKSRSSRGIQPDDKMNAKTKIKMTGMTGLLMQCVFAYGFAFSSPLQAQGASLLPSVASSGDAKSSQLVLSDFPGALVDKVVVPVPGEIFAVMDKLGAPNWSGELREISGNVPSDRIVLSLSFGATIAEGFLAVQAEEGEAVKDLGRRLLKLASALAIEDRVLPHYQSIIDATDAADWRRVRGEIDRTQQTVREAMVELRDDELATLVSLGGWLRGTEALTSLIGAAYSSDRAELLSQPDLVRHFVESLSEMSDTVSSHKDVAALAEGLVAIHESMVAQPVVDDEVGSAGVVSGERGSSKTKTVADSSDGVAPSVSGTNDAIEADAVKRIGDVCSDLLERFLYQTRGERSEGVKGGWWQRRSVLWSGVVMFFAASVGLHAILDEARSVALEAASPYVEVGFEMREDHWGGKLKSGESKVVQHQLFRGNEYWFWGGTSAVESDVEVLIFDSTGGSVALETFSADGKAGARALPVKTGSYLIQVTVTTKGGIGKPDWALVYGYR